MAATSCLFTLLSQERGVRDRRRLEGEQITTVEKNGQKAEEKDAFAIVEEKKQGKVRVEWQDWGER